MTRFLVLRLNHNMSRVMKKPTFCICENKDADQLRGNRKADQRLCFRYIDITIPLLSKSGGRTGLMVRALDFGSKTRVRSSAGSVCLFP